MDTATRRCPHLPKVQISELGQKTASKEPDNVAIEAHHRLLMGLDWGANGDIATFLKKENGLLRVVGQQAYEKQKRPAVKK
jgi:hypothetical protein